MLTFLLLLESTTPSLAEAIRKGIDPCRGEKGTVVVCGRRDGASPYRLPPGLRPDGFRIDGPVDSVSRSRHKLMDGDRTTSDDCGTAACMTRKWHENGQQAGFPPGIHIGPQ